ncbi:lipocalin family protein [Niabella sp. CJ426]|uniref:lipocalin family protein n=1 Tax=Niabella sp. CJ426 TaxID=3393740 RepID=UPI003D03D845
MKKILLGALTAAITVGCNKTESIKTDKANILGAWKVDSSIYQAYENNKLVKEEIDGNDGSEEETFYFLDNGTFKYYYVSFEIRGKSDTLEIIPGRYSFNGATNELFMEDATNREIYKVLSLTNKNLVYSIEKQNPKNPGLPGINTETISLYASRLR